MDRGMRYISVSGYEVVDWYTASASAGCSWMMRCSHDEQDKHEYRVSNRNTLGAVGLFSTDAASSGSVCLWVTPPTVVADFCAPTER
eukprot:38158-Eustigmatos_ZCMA.PRE.1